MFFSVKFLFCEWFYNSDTSKSRLEIHSFAFRSICSLKKSDCRESLRSSLQKEWWERFTLVTLSKKSNESESHFEKRKSHFRSFSLKKRVIRTKNQRANPPTLIEIEKMDPNPYKMTAIWQIQFFTLSQQWSESLHKNQARHGGSGCNGICLAFLHIWQAQKPDICRYLQFRQTFLCRDSDFFNIVDIFPL